MEALIKKKHLKEAIIKREKNASSVIEATRELFAQVNIFNQQEKVAITFTKGTSRKQHLAKRRQHTNITNSMLE